MVELVQNLSSTEIGPAGQRPCSFHSPVQRRLAAGLGTRPLNNLLEPQRATLCGIMKMIMDDAGYLSLPGQ